MNPIADKVSQITGFLLPEEVDLLYQLALETPTEGVIVEIGAYQGKSTVCLGLGAQIAGARVWAIDSYAGYMAGSQHYFGMDSHAALLRNLTTFEVGNTVRVIALSSAQAVCGWREMIDLLFIDGGHDYRTVKFDFEHWSPFVTGKIVFHDTAGDWPGVTQLIDEIVRAGIWCCVKQVGTASVFKKAVQS